VNLAEVERGRLAYERLEAELLVGRALNELRVQLDLPAEVPLELTTPLGEPQLVETPLETLIAEAQRRRQEMAVLEASRSQLDAQIVRLRREVVPSPSLFVDVMAQQPGQLYAGGGIAFALPLWRRNQGPIAIARAEKAQTEEELGIAASQIAIEVAGALRATRTHAEEARLWAASVIPAAESNVELVTQGWRAGKFDIFRVVQVAREAGEARRRQLEVVGALWNAAIALERAAGIL
jgi:outer membrane protein TolC